MVSARLRHGGSWSDPCILNISKRGLMIHTGRPVRDGAEVELRRGNHVIVARVMWRDGGRAGLHSEVPVPVEDILTLGQSPALQLTAAPGERRQQRRREDSSRLRGRAIEFAGGIVIAASLASAGLVMVQQAFAQPLAAVETALGQ
jgi:hypothetical protein